ncbi:AFR055Wp [Eremothecium gossypii ATCC 10895]|uniref:AFR055Wp n=1 Tax=Eremothecium gossypii (strain ATCC 10895 / CBS 109.51 / FGSC 9923 / NRRL Y-1056) TaxID=284811 RepID=Q754L7_EREGS|nr:AFR055Wp [Eremothecium gossypii ATCC 10895]AAS53426.1 AFR055Wp [Eremothecium gossypii ATCC 10895]AEY97738.1 FAFR055Wp [Eremothecium gossypii FDAG1]
MEYIENFKYNLKESFHLDLHQGFRLLIIVAGYMLLRTQLQKILANRELKRKLAQDQAEEKRKRERLVEDPNQAPEAESTPFGWGEKARLRARRQEQLLQERAEQLQHEQAGADEDKDIEDLLEE